MFNLNEWIRESKKRAKEVLLDFIEVNILALNSKKALKEGFFS